MVGCYFIFINDIKEFNKKQLLINDSPFNLALFNQCHTIWGVGIGCANELDGQGRYYSQKKINIAQCSFSMFDVFVGRGGIIFVDISSLSMDVSYSMFYNCTCTLYGGAIYYYSTNSSLKMICANRCSCKTSLNYNFAYINCNQVNTMEFLSVSQCSHSTYGEYSFRISRGNQSFENTNSSMNNDYTCSGIGIDSPSSFTSSHCTFSDNKVSSNTCIHFSSFYGTMTYAIIVNNDSNYYGIVTVEGGGTPKMNSCIFKNNQNTLFCVKSGSLEISDSYIDHSGKFSTSSSVFTESNNTFIATMTYHLQFFDSHYCHADNPLPDHSPMYTVEPTPINTLESTIINTPEVTPTSSYIATPMNTPDPSTNESGFEALSIALLSLAGIGIFVGLTIGIFYYLGHKDGRSESEDQNDQNKI